MTIDFYNTHATTDVDPTKIAWSDLTKQNKNRKLKYVFNAAQIIESVYRPFCKENLYFDEQLNERRGQMKKFFPTGKDNLLICINAKNEKFSPFITDKIADLHFNGDTQCFPLHWYERALQENLFGEKFERRDGVSDWILRRAHELYGSIVKKEDIFYYVYGFLHLPAYREKFSSELKKSLPRIFLVDAPEKFWSLSRAGRRLADIHLNYENQPAPDGVQVIGGENFRVKKMKLSKDKTTLIYNEHIKIKNIPPRAFEYVVNVRSPLEWVIERYQLKTDKASGIVNDPNAWAAEHGDEKYILNLVLSLISVSLKPLEIVEDLPR